MQENIDEVKLKAANRVFGIWASATYLLILTFLAVFWVFVERMSTRSSELGFVLQTMFYGLGLAGFVGSKAVVRAGLSQKRTETFLLSQPLPDAELPPIEFCRHQISRQNSIRLFVLAIPLLLVTGVAMIGIVGFSQKNILMVTGSVGFTLTALISIFVIKAQRRQAVIGRIDNFGITIQQGKLRVIPWEQIQSCRISAEYDVFGKFSGSTFEVIGHDGKKISMMRLPVPSIPKEVQTGYVEAAKGWFGVKGKDGIAESSTQVNLNGVATHDISSSDRASERLTIRQDR